MPPFNHPVRSTSPILSFDIANLFLAFVPSLNHPNHSSSVKIDSLSDERSKRRKGRRVTEAVKIRATETPFVRDMCDLVGSRSARNIDRTPVRSYTDTNAHDLSLCREHRAVRSLMGVGRTASDNARSSFLRNSRESRAETQFLSPKEYNRISVTYSFGNLINKSIFYI